MRDRRMVKMTKFEETLKKIVASAGASGMRELEDALESLSKNADEPWKKTVLGLASDAVERYGLPGLSRVEELLRSAVKGREPDLSFASLRARSDYLSTIQNMEADDKKKVRDFYLKVGHTLGIILKAIIVGLAG